MAGTISALTCAPRGHDGVDSRAPFPAHADNGLRLPARPALLADYGFAIQVLLSDYSDVMTPAELEELCWMSAQPALPPLKHARLSVLASIAVTRAPEVWHG